jgi:diguanylate cyclase (GGDEF)-like protein
VATILIVDERAVVRQLVSLLEPHGHRLLEAADAQKALEIARTEAPQLVVIDILMPKLDGYQFALQLRAQSDGAEPGVVFLAADCMLDEARALAQACGVSRLVTKPVDPKGLLAVVNAALSEPLRKTGRPGVDPKAVDAYFRSMAGRLYQRVVDLEGSNTQLNRSVAERSDQLEVARSAVQQEVTKRLWAEQELTQANLRLQDRAMRDALTGLYNRGYLEESLEREESRARRSDQPFGVMMADVDHFKRCNDKLCHVGGDAVLRAVGQFLLSLARGEDIPCRYGGEEFVLVMAHASLSTVRERAERLRAGVQKLNIEFQGRPVGPITLSVGVAMFPTHGESGQAVLQAADAALYRAKLSGRNCVVMKGG